MAKTERNNRKEELLAAARERLVEEKVARDSGRSRDDDSGPEIRYRGQIVRSSASGTPGSGSGSGGSKPRGGKGDNEVRDALEKVKTLYRDGLITRAEAEKKRSEILDRL